MKEIFDSPLPELLQEAWKVRKTKFSSDIVFAVPGAKKYESAYFSNTPESFVNISVTGKYCSLHCDHCKGILLKTMIPAAHPRELAELVPRLKEVSTKGVLISGGSDSQGRVPLKNFFDEMRLLKEVGMKAIVHTGLVDRETVKGLKEAGVDQVLLDIIGDRETISRVYHLDKGPEDYVESLYLLKEAGLSMVPHIVAGLNYGKMGSELAALKAVSSVRPHGIVLVVLNPLSGTPMAGLRPTPSAG